MRSSLLVLTATVASVYLMSLILVHLYIHVSLDRTSRDQEKSLTVGELSVEDSPMSVTDELSMLRFDSDRRSGSVLDPMPEEANNSLPPLHPCPESSRPAVGSLSNDAGKLPRRTAGRRKELLRGQKVKDHLHPSHSPCVDLPTSEKDETDFDSFHPIGEEFLYSAYWDDRIESEPTVRIIALLKKPKKKTDVHVGLFCHVPRSPESVRTRNSLRTSSYSVNTGNGSSTVVSVAATFYEMCENHGKEFGGWILSCKLPPDVSLPPCSVYVSSTTTLSHVGVPGTIRLKVLRTQPDRRVGIGRGSIGERFAVCVPPLFGQISEKTFTDFVELTRILGADHLFFYVPRPVPTELLVAVDRYVRLGVVSAVPWTVPVSEHAIWYSGQLLAINDCLYRSMHAFQFVAFNDLDEFVVPRRHSHWSEMIDALKDLPPEEAGAAQAHCGYSFKSAFFDPMTDLSPGAGHRVHYELESNLRTKSFSRIRNKLIVAPSLLFELGIHHISRPLEVGKCSVLNVDPETAFVHHYRECTTSFDGKMNCKALCVDEAMSAFLSILRP